MEATMPKPAHTDHELAQAIGDRVRQVRASRMTQEKLAEKLAVAPETISRYETGAIPLSVTMVFRVAEALGVGVEALLPMDSGIPDEDELLERFRALDEGGKVAVLDVLRRMSP